FRKIEEGEWFYKILLVAIPVIIVLTLIAAVLPALMLETGKDGYFVEETAVTAVPDEKLLEVKDEPEQPSLAQQAQDTSTAPQLPVESSRAETDKNNINLNILNGNGISGAGRGLAQKLKAEGYNVAAVGNADHYGYEKTIIRYEGPHRPEAEALQELLRKLKYNTVLEIKPQTGEGINIEIVLGAS
ncbi:MAG: LytR C-terminal domain-containing protein, partial [Candidatus Doudnabacteria bacterium]|nr:LytR C-terminal domain-containing protein [Candidatus Doudnabacteria bacterium]